MHLVKCQEKYWDFVLFLRNDLREFFFTKEEISKDKHRSFMEENNDSYFICLSKDGEPMGWVGVVENDVRVAVHPNYQKQGVGKFMLSFIKEEYPYATAKISRNNKASLNLFNSAGVDFNVK